MVHVDKSNPSQGKFKGKPGYRKDPTGVLEHINLTIKKKNIELTQTSKNETSREKKKLNQKQA